MEIIPYGRQLIDDDDIKAVVEVLRSDWLTTGPKVREFEYALAAYCDASYALAVSSGTAALHLAVASAGLGPGDEVIVPALTFVATANSVVYVGATPVFADVCADTLLIDPRSVEELISENTKAIIAVDYAGQPCDYNALSDIAKKYGLILISDACHSLGGTYKGRPVGSLADMTVFSFHPVKSMTTGEGGAVLFKEEIFFKRARRLRNHGIDLDFRQRNKSETWEYDMIDLGYNYRITDFQCALGLSQLSKLKIWIKKRNELAEKYKEALSNIRGFNPLKIMPEVKSSYHLFVVLMDDSTQQEKFFHYMRSANIGVNVHYKPVYLHSYYQQLGYKKNLCPVAEDAYSRIISLPIYHSMKDKDLEYVLKHIMLFANHAS